VVGFLARKQFLDVAGIYRIKEFGIGKGGENMNGEGEKKIECGI
jgi:hypothetical protein